ncbi:hypothetical protein BN14_06526 [Rhizoctonia solani AG-1 IB]|uniref:Uncharacterized protein n=1 Tax=Thanatephorus cucumeris (strain AG1-IB / isolate 7/3/14) TaxID=1108050 RepID=M5BZ30_THACB|nr:hypothetical protein BN14_06526 [Rhizoctonia solani AG-1 IB]
MLEDMSRILLRALRIEDEPRIGDTSYPRELLNQAYPNPPLMTESTERAIDELILGIEDHWSSIRGNKATLRRDDTGSTSGSDSGAKPAARGDDPAVRDATDHVAKWTTLGPNIEMRDAGKGLKTIEPEQPCVSPRRLELKQSSTRRKSGPIDGKGEGKGDGGEGGK